MKKTIKSFLVKKMPVSTSKYLYYRAFKKRLNLKNPATFNEKLMWLKLFEDDALKIKCADKFLVRDYVSILGFSELLIDLHGVYGHVEEIDFNNLPNSFVMKCSHGSGFNIICPNKEVMDEKLIKSQLKKWLNTDYGTQYCESHYSSIKPRITVEEFLTDEIKGQVPIDYMVHCFHGVPQLVEVGVDCRERGKYYNMYNCDWDFLPYYKDFQGPNEIIEIPGKLSEMLEISRALSKDFTYVRVDLYYCQKKIYFGELTFTPGACLEREFINDGEYRMGELLDLTKLKRQMQPTISQMGYLK